MSQCAAGSHRSYRLSCLPCSTSLQHTTLFDLNVKMFCLHKFGNRANFNIFFVFYVQNLLITLKTCNNHKIACYWNTVTLLDCYQSVPYCWYFTKHCPESLHLKNTVFRQNKVFFIV